jgi:hypothetical protein
MKTPGWMKMKMKMGMGKRGDEDEDGEMMIVNDREGEGDKELLEPHTRPVLSVDVHVGAPPGYHKSEEEGKKP